MLAIELINSAFRLAGFIAVGEKPNGDDVSSGLELLNGVLSRWSSMESAIPSTGTVSVQLTQGVSEYFVSPLITSFLEGHIVSNDNVQTPLIESDEYLDNRFNYALVKGRPYYVFLENEYDFIDLNTGESSTKLSFYPVPDQNYTVQLRARQVINHVKFQDAIKLPPYAQNFLKLELALRLCDMYGKNISPFLAKDYEEARREFKVANDADLSINIDNPFRSFARYKPWGYYGGF